MSAQSLFSEVKSLRNICSIHQNDALSDRSPTMALFPRAICYIQCGNTSSDSAPHTVLRKQPL